MYSCDSGDTLIEVRRKTQANLQELSVSIGYSGTLEAIGSGMGLKEFRDSCRYNFDLLNADTADTIPPECYPVNGDMLGDVRRRLNCAFGNPLPPKRCADDLEVAYKGDTVIVGDQVFLQDTLGNGHDAQCFGYLMAFDGLTNADFDQIPLTGTFRIRVKCIPGGEGVIIGGGNGTNDVEIRVNAAGAIEFKSRGNVRSTSVQDGLIGERIVIDAYRGSDNRFFVAVDGIASESTTYVNANDMSVKMFGANHTTDDDYFTGVIEWCQVQDGFGTETNFWTFSSGSDSEQTLIYDCTGEAHAVLSGPVSFDQPTDEPYLIHYGFARVENQLLYSTDFTQAEWVKSDVSVDRPGFGWNTAAALTPDSNAAYLSQVFTSTDSVTSVILELSEGVSNSLNIGLHDGTYNNHSVKILDGPGAATIDSDGSALITGLTEDTTIVQVIKSNASGSLGLRLRPNNSVRFRGIRAFTGDRVTGYRQTLDTAIPLTYVPASRVDISYAADGLVPIPDGVELIEGGDFSIAESVDEWTPSNSDLSLVDDNLVVANDSNIAGWAIQSQVFVPGQTYWISFSVELGPGTSGIVKVGQSTTNNWLGATYWDEDVKQTEPFVASAADGFVMLGVGSSNTTASRVFGNISMMGTESQNIGRLTNPPEFMSTIDIGYFKLPEEQVLLDMDEGVDFFFTTGTANEITGTMLREWVDGNYGDQYFYGPTLTPSLFLYTKVIEGDCLDQTNEYVNPTGAIALGTTVLFTIGTDGYQYGYKRNNYGGLSPDAYEGQEIRALRSAGANNLRLRFNQGAQVPGVLEFNCKLFDRDITLTWDGGSYSGYSNDIRAALAAEEGTIVNIVITKGT